FASNYRNNQWGNPVALENDDTTAAQFARAVIDSAGNVTAVWVQGDSTQRSLMSAHFSASSLSWGSAQAISSADIPVAEHPEIGLA
ncbi:hypothetical protein ABTB40_20845, partial [Acinetobacter baumannii]